jgi:Asp-tRNA(Asn)/Glu-tRNA(Gln) amidotransferase C subunit
MTDRIGPEEVKALAAAAGLPISKERAAELAGTVRTLLEECRRLEAVDVSAIEAPIVFPP